LETLVVLKFDWVNNSKIYLSVFNFIGWQYLTYSWNWTARGIRITRVRLFTAAERNVIGNPTVRFKSTRTCAWINAFVAQTAFIARAIRIQETLGSA
jgi:hypothetical protein